MVDDAHGEGVLGRGGRGIVDHFGLHGVFDVEIGTLSKAFGVVGGVVAGKKVIVDYLRQKARPVPLLQRDHTRQIRPPAWQPSTCWKRPRIGCSGCGITPVTSRGR